MKREREWWQVLAIVAGCAAALVLTGCAEGGEPLPKGSASTSSTSSSSTSSSSTSSSTTSSSGGTTTTWAALTATGGVFADHCQSCHGALGGLSLMPDQYATLVTGAKMSTEKPSLKLIDPVVNGRSSSYLYLKMIADSSITGTVMPPTGALGASLTDEVGAWIDAGAPQQ